MCKFLAKNKEKALFGNYQNKGIQKFTKIYSKDQQKKNKKISNSLLTFQTTT